MGYRSDSIAVSRDMGPLSGGVQNPVSDFCRKRPRRQPNHNAYAFQGTEKYAKDLIWWADFRLQDVERQRERRKTRAKEDRKKKEEETWKHEKPTLGLVLAKFNGKTGEKLRFFDQKVPTS